MTNETSWLDYSKTILRKVSFDPKIFQKELLKSLTKLNKEDILRLQNWCKVTFSASLAIIAVQIIQEYLMQMV